MRVADRPFRLLALRIILPAEVSMAVRYEPQGKVALITLDRPEALNTFDRGMHNELRESWLAFRDDPSLWVAIVTGEGDRAFSAGADVRGFGSQPAAGEQRPMGPARHLWDTRYDWDLQGGLEVWKPTIAAINGYCIGEGLTFALACDLRIASDRATFAYPEVQIGIPTIAGAIRAPRVVGLGAALELLLIGDRIDAQRAYDMGLVNKVVPHEDLMAEATRWAERLARNAPQAMAATKEVAYRSQHMAFDDALRMGEAYRKLAGGTDDAREGVRAFREKRDPEYHGV
jgi:enoyl-CoA hydratase/carnithine racemase